MNDRMSASLPTGLKDQIQERNRRRVKGNEGRVGADSRAMATRNDPAPALRSERRPLDTLKDAERRARRTSPAQLERVTHAVSQFGFLKPVLIDASGRIVDGHILVEVARRMGLPDIECTIIDHLSNDELRLARIALNRIAETGEWDLEELGLELSELDLSGLDLDVSGFSRGELDLILDSGSSMAALDKGVPAPPMVSVSQPGDLWLLGEHRLLCADALDPASYERLLGSAKIDCVFSDPPYNIKIDGVVSGLGKTKHRDFAMGVGEMSDDQFRTFLADYLKLSKAHANEGAVIFACMDWRQVDLLLFAGRDAGLHRINKAIWNKGTGGMGGLYRSGYEEVVVFCNGSTPATNNVQLGRHGRNRTNVWTYPGANQRGSSAGKALGDHPTPKPVELVADALYDVTGRGDLVFDPFMGSGTTLIAAQATDRIAYGIELDPAYVDVTIQRWQAMTGGKAVHAELGLSFEQLKEERLDQAD
ncbi:DNA methylase [Sphingomonas sp. Root710]|nr:DNA methylase [Sphingomonas sp. Root710]